MYLSPARLPADKDALDDGRDVFGPNSDEEDTLADDEGLPGVDLFPDKDMGISEGEGGNGMQVDIGLLASITRSCGTAQKHAKHVN